MESALPRIGRLPLGRIAGVTLRGGPAPIARSRRRSPRGDTSRAFVPFGRNISTTPTNGSSRSPFNALSAATLVSGLQCLDDAHARNARDARRAAPHVLAHMEQARRDVHDHRNGENDHRGHRDDHAQLLLDGKVRKPTKQGMLLRWRALGGWPLRMRRAPRMAALLRMSAFAVKSVGGKSDANHVAPKTGGRLQVSRLCRIGLCAGLGDQAAGVRPIEGRAGVGLSPRSDIAVADHARRRESSG